MMRRRRSEGGLSLSLLDTMTCGFGALILLFILKDDHTATQLAAAESANAVLAAATQEEPVQRVRALAWIERARAEARKSAGTDVFGLPPLEGDVVFLIDTSFSMVGSVAKTTSVRQTVLALVEANQRITDVSVVTFSDRTRLVASWTRLGPAELPKLLDTALTCREEGTLLVAGIVEGLKSLQRREGGTMVVLSDGVGSDSRKLSSEEFIAKIREGASLRDEVARSITVHTLGLFAFNADKPSSLGGRFEEGGEMERLGIQLQKLAMSFRGVYIGLPIASQGLRQCPS